MDRKRESQNTNNGSQDRQSCGDQRGIAAQLRQINENKGGTLLSQEEKNFVNEVIHDPDTNHRPDFDDKLDALKERINPPDCDLHKK
jgi:hypothetical protein